MTTNIEPTGTPPDPAREPTVEAETIPDTASPAVSAASDKPSMFERADKVADGVDTAMDFLSIAMVYVMGIVAIVFAIFGFIYVPSMWWAALVIGGYGIYLLIPGGDKWVIY